MKLNYINLTTTDPAYNLAAEEYVFGYLPKDRMYLMLWQNDNAIIIGKYQNTLAEINEEYITRNNIKVIRRLSGGGAVYHDLGNLNYTIITDIEDTDALNFRLFCEPVVKALEKIGVKACVNGRNDVTIEDKKISGTAQYVKDGRVMHHGTLLLNSNLETVGKALSPDADKFESKGKKSVKSRVTNVSDILDVPMNINTFKKILLDTVLEENEGEEYVFTDRDIDIIKSLKEDRYDKWEWNYGKSKECSFVKSRRIEGVGKIEASISCEHSVITGIDFTGDFFSKKEPEELGKLFIGCRADEDEYRKILKDINCSDYFNGIDNETFMGLLI